MGLTLAEAITRGLQTSLDPTRLRERATLVDVKEVRLPALL
jgi:hypothetical protein